MTLYEANSIRRQMQPFFTLMIVIASTVMLASCGGSNKVNKTHNNVPIMITTGDEIIPFDKSKVISNTPNKPLDQSTGYISNQMWVVSNNVSKDELLSIISNYKKLQVIAYDNTFGALIEFDEKDKEAISQINLLKSENRIKSVFYEYFSGKNVNHDFYTPDNGSNFDDGGNNWGLEEIRITKAWDITIGEKTGNENIGIIDSGFLTTHRVLSNRLLPVGQIISDDHGTAVAGIIGGWSKNNDGFSGINQKSDIFIMLRECDNRNFQKHYINLIRENKIKVINNSWGCMDASNSNANINDGFNATRKFRAIAALTPETIHVWSSGNAGAGASTQNGALHLDDNRNEDKLDNIITVASYGNNDALVSYSNYGGLVDIAIPTDIKAPSADGEYYQATKSNYIYGDSKLILNNTEGFAGTSASAPILTGVISLMLSVNSTLTPKQVKDILIQTSTKTILKRTLTDGTLEDILPIPTLNAEKAVRAALNYRKPTDITPKTATVDTAQEFILTGDGLLEKPYSIAIEGCPSISYISATSTKHIFSCTPTDALSSLVVITNPDTGALVSKQLSIDFTAAPVVLPTALKITLDAQGIDAVSGVVNGNVSFITGRNGGKAAKFNGVNDPASIRVPNTDNIKFDTGATFDMWVRRDSMTGMNGYAQTVNDGQYVMALLAKSHDSNGTAFTTTGTGKSYWNTYDQSWFGNSNCTTDDAFPVIPIGEWYRITYTVSPTTGIQTYINKQLYVNCPDIHPSFDVMNTQDLYIGQYRSFWYPLDGAIQDIHIYKAALTSSQVSVMP
jgi:hypothetical protein